MNAQEQTGILKERRRRVRIRIQIDGDDGYCWCLIIDGRTRYDGMTKSEASWRRTRFIESGEVIRGLPFCA